MPNWPVTTDEPPPVSQEEPGECGQGRANKKLNMTGAVGASHRVLRHARLPDERPHPTDVVPIGLTIEGRSDKGFSFTPYEGGSNTNIVTILYVAKRV